MPDISEKKMYKVIISLLLIVDLLAYLLGTCPPTWFQYLLLYLQVDDDRMDTVFTDMWERNAEQTGGLHPATEQRNPG